MRVNRCMVAELVVLNPSAPPQEGDEVEVEQEEGKEESADYGEAEEDSGFIGNSESEEPSVEQCTPAATPVDKSTVAPGTPPPSPPGSPRLRPTSKGKAQERRAARRWLLPSTRLFDEKIKRPSLRLLKLQSAMDWSLD